MTTAPTIAVVAFDGINPFHLSVPSLVFDAKRQALGVPAFCLHVCAAEPGPLRTSAGYELRTRRGLGALRTADMIIVPSWHDDCRPAPPPLLRALQRAHARGARIVSLCLGAFVLAQAGLLDGRRATTHWHWADQMAERHPAVQLDRDVLYVDEGDIVSSAGVAAALDCCLYLLRGMCGAEVANRVARRLVIAPHREGGQAQFIETPVPASRSDDRVARVLAWAASRLDQELDLDTLAARAAMSRRSFTRHFRAATGTSFLQWLLDQRLARARRLLETHGQSMEEIAQAAGFGSALSLRQHFRAALGVTPTAYRQQFGIIQRSS